MSTYIVAFNLFAAFCAIFRAGFDFGRGAQSQGAVFLAAAAFNLACCVLTFWAATL